MELQIQLFHPQEAEKNFGVIIDVDFGALSSVAKAEKKKHSSTVLKLSLEPGYMLQSLNSSLGFAHTAIGKINGFINVFNHPWDICAASFLIQQSGGIITDLGGSPWELSSVGAMGSNNAAIRTHLKTPSSAQ